MRLTASYVSRTLKGCRQGNFYVNRQTESIHRRAVARQPKDAATGRRMLRKQPLEILKSASAEFLLAGGLGSSRAAASSN
jgi:hypothetical protein